ncbi:FtsJ-like methyltransferase family protein [Leishmania donovani]|uniref:FtsJ-like methyltransferase family protein n=1 Tax=Leishmania donovani TaxID=5661 RepID=A0A504XGJ1_LEIDO|nr:FtsJ-like methyltransferase family protein [Leishmania donovani]
MGVKSKKKAKTRLDAYYRLAKDQGYRARSAYKLIQLNRKYDFLAKSRVLVDLCAAPGGWCQVAAQHMAIGSKIVGVDLVPIAPIRGVKTFVGDITDDKTRKMIVTYLKKEPVDCVIHDGAPNVGGVWSRDLFDQNALVLASAKMACSMLKANGWFVTKVFRSPDFHNLLWVFKQLFEKVEATKPQASRMESAEIFVVCAGFKAPKSIDPAFFNPQKVFAEVGQEKIVSASGMLVAPKSNVPTGYDEFATVSHHVASFSDFLNADDPKVFLKTHHELRFSDDADKEYLKSKSSKKELVYLCGDLQQVGEADLRRMLRWREQLLREKTHRIQVDAAGTEEGGDLKQIKGLINYDPNMSQLGLIPEKELAHIMDKTWTEPEDRGNDPLNPVMSVNLAAQDDWDLGDKKDGDESEAEGDDDGVPHSAQLVEGEEHFMDVDNYGNYVPAQRSTRVTLYEAGLEGYEDSNDAEAADETPASKKKRAKAEKDAAQLEEAGKSSKWERHQLNIEKVLNDTFPKPKDHDRAKNKKRQRTLEEERIIMSVPTEMADPDKRKHLSDGDLDDYEINRGREDSRRKRKLIPDIGKVTTQELIRQQRKQTLQDNKEVRKQNKRNKNNTNSGKNSSGKQDTEFEEIPIAMTDPDIRARTLAIAQKMLDPKARREILDASVNRYVFNDDDDLPDWFVKDEQRNCRVVLPVTAEEIEEQRRRFQELNARPSRKVMEAMGRKRRKAQRMLRSLIDKGKADPRAREKAENLSVRKLMRSQVVKGQGKKRHKYLDRQLMGRMRREKQKLKRRK